MLSCTPLPFALSWTAWGLIGATGLDAHQDLMVGVADVVGGHNDGRQATRALDPLGAGGDGGRLRCLVPCWCEASSYSPARSTPGQSPVEDGLDCALLAALLYSLWITGSRVWSHSVAGSGDPA